LAACSHWSAPKYVLAALALVSAGVSAYGAIKGGNDQADALAGQAGAHLAQADEAVYLKNREIEAKKQEALTQAGRIRERARSIRSTQRAQAGASGAVVDTGSAQHMVDQTNFLAERDALAVAYSANNFTNAREHEINGINKAGINSAKSKTKMANAALVGGYTQATGSALGGAANAYAAL